MSWVPSLITALSLQYTLEIMYRCIDFHDILYSIYVLLTGKSNNIIIAGQCPENYIYSSVCSYEHDEKLWEIIKY